MNRSAPSLREILFAVHDSRNALASVSGLCHLSKSAYSSHIQTAIEKVSDILETLINKETFPHRSGQLEPISPKHWLEGIQQRLQALLLSQNQTLLVSANSDLVSYVHPLLLERTLSNLVLNASRALLKNKDGAGKIEVSITRLEGGNLHIQVCDNGPGLPTMAENNPGLGLESVQYCTARAGGTFSINSKPGETHAKIWLPNQAPLLLIVEDDLSFGHVLKTALEEAGYKAFWASSATELASALETVGQDVGLILADSGMNLSPQISQFGKPIITLSGYGCSKQTPTNLIKPFAIPQLMQLIEETLKNMPASDKATQPKQRLLIIHSPYYQHIDALLLQGAENILKQSNVEYDTLAVPGALEIPPAIAMALKSGSYSAFVALGCVIEGETKHFDIVAQESARQLTQLATTYALPIANGILTVGNEQQALERADPNKKDKGGWAARACLAMMQIRDTLT